MDREPFHNRFVFCLFFQGNSPGRESLQENNTVENMERIFKAPKAHGFEVFISPHYFYPTDKG